MKEMKDKIVTARRVIDFPWAYGLSEGAYEMSTGRQLGGGYFSKSSYAYACMVIRGTELANLPWQITRNGKPLEKHPLIDMLTQFGPESNYNEAVVSTEIDLLLAGQAFWLRDVDIMKRLNPTTIEVVKTNAGISEFKQTLNGTVTNRFAREEIVYFREYHPDDDLGAGIPAVQIAKTDINLEREATLYINAFFKNDATPSLLLSSEQKISTPEMNKVLAWWNSKFRGRRNAHKVAMADRGLKAQILSQSLKDNAVIEIRAQARSGICVVFRVPEILVGSMIDATYANAQEARKFMIEDLILPRSVYYQDAINQDLVAQVDPGVKFEFVPDELPILQGDANLKWMRLSSGIDMGVITKEFAAEEMGWPAPEVEFNPLTTEEADIRSWKRKAKKSFKAGNGANVDFETDEISMSRQMAIRAKLADVKTVRDVTVAFK